MNRKMQKKMAVIKHINNSTNSTRKGKTTKIKKKTY